MQAARLRALVIAAVAVAALLAVWLTLAPHPDTAADALTPAPSGDDASTRPAAALDSLDPPDDLDAARQVARRFATSLYRDDLAGMRRLATAELARRLGLDQPTGSQPVPASSVRVDGITTEDLRPDQVLLQVTVDREGRLETATLSVARTDSGWRVAEAAF